MIQRLERLRSGLTVWFKRRTGDLSEAQDLVQESFLRIVQKEGVDELEHLEGYAYRVAANILIDRHRRRRARHIEDHVGLEEVGQPTDGIDPHRELEARLALAASAEALGRLPERTRTIFILRRLEGMRHKEIAVRLGISVSAVEKHVVRAMTALAAGGEDER
ncbi:RNA polymerase sigma factor [Sphingomonas sp. S2-65]|uniref:RNA polymerase sigma factor n=1 Tax=Sphingomonas sp. S2-65 TaxID=2903960 RepID=UPI001F24EE7D|nr:RNA polymerase sigma factor [Sphingomonas sp. S2-65]UYY58031.1 RNA polymerase sigma factor [Sphingomonas sp. S2-65]